MSRTFDARTDEIRLQLDSAFEKILVQHEHFREAFERCVDAMEFEPPDTIIAVLGPSGVGKSSLLKQLYGALIKHRTAIGLRQGEIPAIRVEVPSTERRPYPWRPVYQAILEQQGEPLLDSKIDLQAELRKLKGEGFPVKGSQVSQQTLYVLRRLIERNLELRHTRALMLDEAQHFTKVSSIAALQDQMDHLKSLTNGVSTRLILFGTGEMIDLLDQSAQLARRTLKIGFGAYPADTNGRRKFAEAVKALLERSPVTPSFSVAELATWLHQSTAGLFGVAATWVRRASALALLRGSGQVERAHFEATAVAAGTLDQLIREANQCASYVTGKVVVPISEPRKSKDGREGRSPPKPGRPRPRRREVGRSSKGKSS